MSRSSPLLRLQQPASDPCWTHCQRPHQDEDAQQALQRHHPTSPCGHGTIPLSSADRPSMRCAPVATELEVSHKNKASQDTATESKDWKALHRNLVAMQQPRTRVQKIRCCFDMLALVVQFAFKKCNLCSPTVHQTGITF